MLMTQNVCYKANLRIFQSWKNMRKSAQIDTSCKIMYLHHVMTFNLLSFNIGPWNPNQPLFVECLVKYPPYRWFMTAKLTSPAPELAFLITVKSQ